MHNLTKARLVFQESGFKEGKEWGYKDEVFQQDLRVIVLFPENVWVDARTHACGLKHVLKPVSSILDAERR